MNVWLVRFNKSTEFRGGSAQNMREEFEVYGFPPWGVYVVGAVRLSLAVALLVGLWVPELVRPAAIALGLLMVGAIGMRVRAGDPPKRAVPATTILVLCALAAIGA